jgi:hypothetical protein
MFCGLVFSAMIALAERRTEVLAMYATLAELVDELGCPSLGPESLREPNIRL